MSDEEGEIHEALHASNNAESTTSDDTPWQMQDLHELISLQQVEEFTTPEIQHIYRGNAKFLRNLRKNLSRYPPKIT